MTEALEKRITTIFDGLEHGIITVSDGYFMKEFIRAQGRKVEELNEQLKEETQTQARESGDQKQESEAET